MTSASHCFVLMPFEEALEHVYTDAIKPAIERFSNHIPDLQIARADSVYEPRKMDFIRERIRTATVVIIDITGLRPAVMWELGFADACDKEMIVIGNVNSDALPFNLKNLDYITYQPDQDGILTLKHRLVRAMDQRVSATVKRRNSYVEHPRWIQALRQSVSTLSAVPKSSVLKVFVARELNRSQNQMARLSNGDYLLRNERPMEEIIDCYCELMDTLDNESCTFDTVTCVEFWRDFTEGGSDNRYSTANVAAAMRGATIRRIFLIDKEKLRHEPEVRRQLQTILHQHEEVTSPQRARIILKVFHTNVSDLRSTYENFALLQRNTETLLLRPTYDQNASGRMLDTKFWHATNDAGDEREDTVRLIKKYRDRFDLLFEKSEEFSPDQMEKYVGAQA